VKIYIASSWKNQHAVEMLTDLLEQRNHKVLCFVRQEAQEYHEYTNFEEWVKSDSANKCFIYDTNGAMFSDLVIYIGPSGIDAWAEIGAAYAKGITILGLQAKDEQVGLMKHMVNKWFNDYRKLLKHVGNI